jgi:hypothetical protein
MDLLGFIGAARNALSYIKPAPDHDASWANDVAEFERHFGVPYEGFIMIIEHLSVDQKKMLDATLEVNPEAAVLWILSMEEVES